MMSNPSLNADHAAEINSSVRHSEEDPLIVNVQSSNAAHHDDLMHPNNTFSSSNPQQDPLSSPLGAPVKPGAFASGKKPMVSFLFFLVALALTLLVCLLYYYNVFASWSLLFKCGGLLGWIFTISFFASLSCLVSWNAFFMRELAAAKSNQDNLPPKRPVLSSAGIDSSHYYSNSPFDRSPLQDSLKLRKSLWKVTKIVFFVTVSIIGAAGILFLLISSLVWWVVRDQTLANRTGVLHYKELHKEVRVEREQNGGLIHIYAESDEDLFFAQGVVAGQERLWQMEFNKRVGQGRLSEIIGDVDEVKDIDRFMRTVGFYRAAQRDWKVVAQTDEKTRVALERFTAGINAYIDSGDAQTPIEFTIFGVETKPWTPEDVIVWIKLMSWDLSVNAKIEAQRYNLMLNGTSYDRVREMFPFRDLDDDEAPTILSRKDLNIDHLTQKQIAEIEARLRDESGSYIPEKASEEKVRNAVRSIAERFDLFAGKQNTQDGADSRASNNWVMGPQLTNTNAPLLCNDPHLGLTSPSIWYLVHLHSPTFDSVGAALPSVPGIIIGRNNDISWGVTNAFADVQDLFVLDEVDEKHYKHPSCDGGVCTYNLIEEKIVVKGGEDITLTVKDSLYGPVINDVMGLSHSDKPLAMWWTTTQLNDTTCICISKLMQAKNWDEFTHALSFYVAPSQNFIYADHQNNIGYYMPGRVPVRKTGHSGRFPVRGNGDWDYMPSADNPEGDFIPFEKLPHVLNPEKGYVVSANNRIPPRGYEYTINPDHAPPYRAERIIQMVEEFSGNHTASTMKQMQMDTFSLLFRDMEFLWNDTEILDLLPKEYHDEWNVLAKWDGNEMWGSQPATLFEGLWKKLRLLSEEKVGIAAHFLMYPWLLETLKSHKVDPVCSKYLSCRRYVVDSFVELVDNLRGGDNGNIPMWAVDCHESKFAHSILDKSPLKCIATRSIKNIGGSMTVNVANSGLHNYVSTEGVSYRQIVSWQDVEEQSVFIAAPGQSGNMLETSYDSWLEMWRKGEYIGMRTNSTQGVSVSTQRFQKKE